VRGTKGGAGSAKKRERERHREKGKRERGNRKRERERTEEKRGRERGASEHARASASQGYIYRNRCGKDLSSLWAPRLPFSWPEVSRPPRLLTRRN